jgi:16S rRNA U516 pseudouridylate synthase RsuA-like enzyme
MTADMAIRKFLKHVGVPSQREIENLVRSGEVMGGKLKLRMTLSAEGTPLKQRVTVRHRSCSGSAGARRSTRTNS